MGEGELQRDPSAHGDPEDVRPLDGQGIHQADDVPGHQLDRVREVRFIAATGATVVEHEDLPAPGQFAGGPGEQAEVTTQAADQDERTA